MLCCLEYTVESNESKDHHLVDLVEQVPSFLSHYKRVLAIFTFHFDVIDGTGSLQIEIETGVGRGSSQFNSAISGDGQLVRLNRRPPQPDREAPRIVRRGLSEIIIRTRRGFFTLNRECFLSVLREAIARIQTALLAPKLGIDTLVEGYESL